MCVRIFFVSAHEKFNLSPVPCTRLAMDGGAGEEGASNPAAIATTAAVTVDEVRCGVRGFVACGCLSSSG